MAAWQCDFGLWPTAPWPTDYRSRLNQIALRGPSWRADLETWGPEDGNRIDLNVQNGVPQDGLLRLDVRNLDPAFIGNTLELLEFLRCELRDSAGVVVEPNVGELMLAVRRSAAYRFVNDPEDYFRRLARGGLSDA